VQRELALVRVNATGENRAELLGIVDIFRCKVVDVSPRSYTSRSPATRTRSRRSSRSSSRSDQGSRPHGPGGHRARARRPRLRRPRRCVCRSPARAGPDPALLRPGGRLRAAELAGRRRARARALPLRHLVLPGPGARAPGGPRGHRLPGRRAGGHGRARAGGDAGEHLPLGLQRARQPRPAAARSWRSCATRGSSSPPGSTRPRTRTPAPRSPCAPRAGTCGSCRSPASSPGASSARCARAARRARRALRDDPLRLARRPLPPPRRRAGGARRRPRAGGSDVIARWRDAA